MGNDETFGSDNNSTFAGGGKGNGSGAAGVAQIVAGPGISIAPVGGTGVVTVTNSAPFVGSAGKISAGDKILYSGDSIIAGWNDFLPTHADVSFSLLAPLTGYLTDTFNHFGLTPPTFSNTGVSGQTTAAWLIDINAQVLIPIAGGVKHVFLCIGANDVATGVAANTTRDNIVAGILLAQAVNPAVFFHVILNAFVFSENPASAFNVSMGVTNKAIAGGVLALSNVIVHDWQSVANAWEARNNPYNQLGLLVQGATHPSKPTGQVVASDCVFADLALNGVPAFYRFQALGTQTPYHGDQWFQAMSLLTSYFFNHTGRIRHYPLRYTNIGTAGGFSANDAPLEGGGMFGNGAQWIVNGSMFQTPKVTPWAVHGRVNLDAQAPGASAEWGVLSAAGAHIVRIRNDVLLGLNARLQFNIGAGPPTTVDLGFQPTVAIHTWSLIFTGNAPAGIMPANTFFWIYDQGAQQGNVAPTAQFPTAPVTPYLQDGGGMKAKWGDGASYFIGP